MPEGSMAEIIQAAVPSRIEETQRLLGTLVPRLDLGEGQAFKSSSTIPGGRLGKHPAPVAI